MNSKKTVNLAIMGLMSAVLCVVSPLSILIGTIPVSLSTMFIVIGIYVIGPLRMSVSVLIYFLMGIIGLPVFSNFKAGIGVIVGPTGGYLMGYVALALIGGGIMHKNINNIRYSILGVVTGNILVYAMGTLWLSYTLEITFKKALLIGVVPFIITDAIKMSVAVCMGRAIKRRM